MALRTTKPVAFDGCQAGKQGRSWCGGASGVTLIIRRHSVEGIKKAANWPLFLVTHWIPPGGLENTRR